MPRRVSAVREHVREVHVRSVSRRTAVRGRPVCKTSQYPAEACCPDQWADDGTAPVVRVCPNPRGGTARERRPAAARAGRAVGGGRRVAPPYGRAPPAHGRQRMAAHRHRADARHTSIHIYTPQLQTHAYAPPSHAMLSHRTLRRNAFAFMTARRTHALPTHIKAPSRAQLRRHLPL